MSKPTRITILNTVLESIDAEPEMPDEMPEEMWTAIRNDKDACTAAFRIAVRQTKEGIRGRILERLSALTRA